MTAPPLYRSRPDGFAIRPASADTTIRVHDLVWMSPGLSNSFLIVTPVGRVSSTPAWASKRPFTSVSTTPSTAGRSVTSCSRRATSTTWAVWTIFASREPRSWRSTTTPPARTTTRASTAFGCAAARSSGARRCAAAAGPLDVLVNNAGASLPGGHNEWKPEVFEESVRINLFGAFRMANACREKLEASRHDGGAAVVNLASMAAYFGMPVVPGYGTAKAGIVQMTKTLAVDGGYSIA